jgi:hypothetical protein
MIMFSRIFAAFRSPVRVLAMAIAAVIGVVSFAAVAHAAGVMASPDASILDLARPVYDAILAGQFTLAGTLAIVLLVAAVKRYFTTGKFGTFVHSDAGGALLALVGGAATAASAGLLAPGASLSLGLFKASVVAGIVAAGGFAIVKNLLVEPLLKPLSDRAPAWMQPVFTLIFWVFDHGVSPTEEATASGTAAVAAKPAAGAASVVGTPTDVK